MKLSKLFQNCAYDIHYQQAGDSVNYAFVEDKNTLYIYFEGSNSITDWVRNFLFTKKVFDEFKVHRGFLAAYLEVRNIILDKAYSKQWKKIIVVGYSHGGALCQLALEDLVYHFPQMQDNIFGYAFESPRCVKAKKKYRSRWKNLTVIRDGNDLVTHCPPKIFGYNDLGTMLKIKGDVKLVQNKCLKCIKYHYPQVVKDGLLKKEGI